jgi:5'-deoxynucleotidase YfbR-like HD superfamily hydrolase
MKLNELFVDTELSNIDTIGRWELNQTIKKETVSQHSFWVSFYSTCLAEELFPETHVKSIPMKLAITRYALFHDLDEAFTGDINHKVKHNPLNGKQIREELEILIQSKVEEKFSSKLPFNKMLKQYITSDDLTNYPHDEIVKSIVKICDWLSFIKYLQNEKSLGNSSAHSTLAYCCESLHKKIIETITILTPFKEELGVNLEVLEDLKTPSIL